MNQKKYSLILFLSLMLICGLKAQIVIIPSANPVGTGLTQSPWRKPFGTNRAYERTAIKYTNAEINASGQITQIGFYCDTINNPGYAKTKIFFKEVTDSTFTASTVATEESGALLVYSDSIPASSFVKGQWTMVNLATPYIYNSTNNLEIIIETNSGGTAGTDAQILGKGFRYSIVTGAREQYWQSATGSGTPPAANGTLINGNRHNVKLVFVPVPACSGTPVAGTTIANPTSVCGNNPVALSLTGTTTALGLTYQWLSSSNGINWAAISGATNPSFSTPVSASTYFACVVTCTGQADTSLSVLVNLNPFYNCYCVSGIGGGCVTQATAIDSVAIGGTTLANGLSGCSTGFYASYPASGNTTATLLQGQSYQFYTSYTGNVKSSVWIDYNHNGVFEPAEWTQLCLTSTANTVVTSQVNIPLTAMTGLTGMRVRSRAANGANDSTTACTTFGSGETEDYLITIDPAQACVAPPTAGVASISNDTICSGNQVTLSVSGFTSGFGSSVQWISSTDGGTTWSNVTGATSPSFNATPTVNTLYACVVTCSGQSDTSSVVSVVIQPFYNCYCVSGIGGGCVNTPATTIDSVAIDNTTLANGLTGCSTTFYTQYPAIGNTTGDLIWGFSYNIYVLLQGNAKCEMWIDYNQNGIFEATEGTQVCTTSTAGVVNVKSFQVPTNVGMGLTGMRIRSRSTAGALDSTSACLNFGSGETEDYLVNLTTPLGTKTDVNTCDFYVFPNPSADGIVNWATHLDSKSSLILQVTNLNGEELHREILEDLPKGNNQRSVNLACFSKGVYFIKFISARGVSVRKIVLQ